MDMFQLDGRAVVITGAGGLLGQEHSLAVGRFGGVPILLDISEEALESASKRLREERLDHRTMKVDLTEEAEIVKVSNEINHEFDKVWGLVNNVASNPPMKGSSENTDRLETFSLNRWNHDISVGLSSAFLCSRVFGERMAQLGGGAIVNVASDLALISPDQRMYATGLGNPRSDPVKPVSYPVIKSALLGLTRYLATYWAPLPVRCNSLLPGSVAGTQSPRLVEELVSRIPLARLAQPNDYHGALVFLLSDASAYMTGSCLIVDGGRTIW